MVLLSERTDAQDQKDQGKENGRYRGCINGSALSSTGPTGNKPVYSVHDSQEQGQACKGTEYPVAEKVQKRAHLLNEDPEGASALFGAQETQDQNSSGQGSENHDKTEYSHNISILKIMIVNTDAVKINNKNLYYYNASKPIPFIFPIFLLS